MSHDINIDALTNPPEPTESPSEMLEVKLARLGEDVKAAAESVMRDTRRGHADATAVLVDAGITTSSTTVAAWRKRNNVVMP